MEDAYLQTSGSGETASGNVVLVYEDKETYRIEYDSVHSPDGLSITVTDEPGDMVQTENNGLVEVSETVIEHAKDTLSKYHPEARKGKGAVEDGQVVYVGHVGVDDGWTPE